MITVQRYLNPIISEILLVNSIFNKPLILYNEGYNELNHYFNYSIDDASYTKIWNLRTNVIKTIESQEFQEFITDKLYKRVFEELDIKINNMDLSVKEIITNNIYVSITNRDVKLISKEILCKKLDYLLI